MIWRLTLLLNGIRWVNGSSFVHNSGCFKMTQIHNGRTDINNSISCWLIKIFQKMDLEDRPFLPYFYNNRNCWFLFRMAAFTIFPYNNSSPNGTKPYSWFREVLNYLSSGFVVGRIEYTDGAIILARWLIFGEISEMYGMFSVFLSDRYRPLIRSRSLPEHLKVTTRLAASGRISPVAGFRPFRSTLSLTQNFPKPLIKMSSPDTKVDFMISSRASVMSAVCFLP